MTARDVQTLISRSPDPDDLWRDVLYLSNAAGHQDLAAFSRDEVAAFVAYCMNAVESAPMVPDTDPGITYDIATQLTYRQELFHKYETNSDGSPLRARVSGQTKTWKTRPGLFQVPLKHGLSTSFGISNTDPSTVGDTWRDPANWVEYSENTLTKGGWNVSAKNISAQWARVNPSIDMRERAGAFVALSLGAEGNLRIGSNPKGLCISVDLIAAGNGTETGKVAVASTPEPAKIGKSAPNWSEEALNAWRSVGAWEEGMTSFASSALFFHYVGEDPVWRLQHDPRCPLSRAGDLYLAASRSCACGALGEAPRMNPSRPRVRVIRGPVRGAGRIR